MNQQVWGWHIRERVRGDSVAHCAASGCPPKSFRQLAGTGILLEPRKDLRNTPGRKANRGVRGAVIKVDGVDVGFIGIDASFEKVNGLNYTDDEKIKHELLLRIKFFGNYVPKDREEAYKASLFEEYNNYLTK